MSIAAGMELGPPWFEVYQFVAIGHCLPFGGTASVFGGFIVKDESETKPMNANSHQTLCLKFGLAKILCFCEHLYILLSRMSL